MMEHVENHIEFFTWIYGPHHKLLVQVRCDVDTASKAVQHAQVLSEPPLTNKDIDFLRRAGLCDAP